MNQLQYALQERPLNALAVYQLSVEQICNVRHRQGRRHGAQQVGWRGTWQGRWLGARQGRRLGVPREYGLGVLVSCGQVLPFEGAD